MQALVLQRAGPKIRYIDLLWVALLAFNLTEFAVAWLRVLYGFVWNFLDLPPTPPLAILDPPSSRAVIPLLLTACAGLVVAVVAARAVSYLASRVTVNYDGLELQSPFGTRFIPDTALRGLRDIDLHGRHFIVWVDATQGLPLQNFLGLLLFNHWSWRGFLLFSGMENFDDAVAHVVLRLRQAHGEDQFAQSYREDNGNRLVQMVVAPLATIHEAVHSEAPLFTLHQAGVQMVSAACALALPLLLASVIHLEVPWAALVLPVVAMGEWPLASVYLSALSEAYARKLSFEEVLCLYPLTQLPRWAVALGLSVAVIAGWPYLLYLPLFIVGIGSGTLLVLKLTEELFDIPLQQAALGILVTVIYQAIVFGLFLAMLSR